METKVLSLEQMAAKVAAEAPAEPAPASATEPKKEEPTEPKGSWRNVNPEDPAPAPASAPAAEGAADEKAELARLKAELEAREKELAELKEKAIVLDDPSKLKEIAGIVHPSAYESDEDLIRAVCVEKGLEEDDIESEIRYVTGIESPLERKNRIESYRKMLAETYDAKVSKFVTKAPASPEGKGSDPAPGLPPQAKMLFEQSMTSLGETIDALDGLELDGVKFTPARTREIYDMATENLNLTRYWEMKDGKPTGKLNIDQAVRDAIVVKYGDIIQKSKLKEAESQGILKAAFLKFRPSAGSGGGGSLDNLSVDEVAAQKAYDAAQQSFGGPARRGGKS